MLRKILNSATKTKTSVGPFSPLSISGCVLWLDGADSSASSMNLSGSNVTQWKDKSSSGLVASQSTSSQQPTLSTNSLNGKSTVNFIAAASQYLQMGTTPLITVGNTSPGYFISILANYTNVGSFPCPIQISTDGTSWWVFASPDYASYGQFGFWDGVNGTGNYSAVSGLGSPPASGTFYALDVAYSGSAFSSYVNSTLGTAGYGAGGSGVTSNANYIGILSFGSLTEALNGNIAEIVIYNRGLTGTEITQLHGYRQGKWGI